MWNLPPPSGFQGLRDDLPLTVYIRHLPHWRQPGATYFVTFRLADSLPQAKLNELATLRREMQQLVGWASQPVNRSGVGRASVGRASQPVNRSDVRRAGVGRASQPVSPVEPPSQPVPLKNSSHLEILTREIAAQVERWLDDGHGSCLLRDANYADHLVESLHHFDGDRYELGAYVVMPNHVHAIVKPTSHDDFPLEDIVGGWKQFSAKRILLQTGQSGSLWQDESHDRIIRDAEHLYRCVQYIGRNPAKANLPPAACPHWIRPEWQTLGWRFEVE